MNGYINLPILQPQSFSWEFPTHIFLYTSTFPRIPKNRLTNNITQPPVIQAHVHSSQIIPNRTTRTWAKYTSRIPLLFIAHTLRCTLVREELKRERERQTQRSIENQRRATRCWYIIQLRVCTYTYIYIYIHAYRYNIRGVASSHVGARGRNKSKQHHKLTYFVTPRPRLSSPRLKMFAHN